MSAYDFRPGGSLKLKGVAEGGIVKKCVPILSSLGFAELSCRKKKKSKSSTKSESTEKQLDAEKLKELLKSEDLVQTSSGSGRDSPSIVGGSSAPRKTEAEKRFEEVQRKRVRGSPSFIATPLLTEWPCRWSNVC